MNQQITAPDLEKQPPRRGRELLGGYAFLARVIDKVRAMHAGTNGEYVGYCAMSLEFLDKAGVSREAFDELIARGASDEQIVAYFDQHVSSEQKAAANKHILEDFAGHLDEQDAEERR
jgi:hypothetical protein